MQQTLYSILGYDINDPAKGMEPLKTRAVSGINKTYDGIGKRMQSTLASRGFERSGANEYGTQDLELARAGQIADTENQFSGMELDQKNRLLQMMQQFGFASPGQNSTGTQPGNVAGGATSGALSTASMLYALNNLK